MSQPYEDRILMDSFKGLYISADPFALPPGAMVDQMNMTLVEAGAITSRRGMQPITFESE